MTSLALTVDSLDSVPEAARGAYVADGDKFKLNVEIEDTTGLKSALAAERALNRTQKAELAAFKKTGRTAAEIAEFVEAQEAAAAEAAKKAGNFDAILTQHKNAWGNEKTTLEKARDNAMSVARGAIVDASVVGALTTAKATGEGLDLLKERLGKRVHLEIADDGKRTVQIMAADGVTPMAGSAPDGSATYDDLVKEAKKTWPSLFEGTGAGGGGTPNKGAGGTGSATMTAKEFGELDAKAKAAAAAKPGFKLVD